MRKNILTGSESKKNNDQVGVSSTVKGCASGLGVLVLRSKIILKAYQLDVYSCANFLIQMYYQIEKKYNLGRIKLERLLAIVELRHMAQKRKGLFGRSLGLTYNGTIEFGLYLCFFPNIVTGQEGESNNPIPVSVEDVEKALADIPKFPRGYEFTMDDPEKRLFAEVRGWLIDAFIQFGDCEYFILTRAINKFKDEIVEDTINIGNTKKYVSAEKVYQYFNRPFNYSEDIDASKLKEKLDELERMEGELKKVYLENGLEIEALEKFYEEARKEEEIKHKAVERVYKDIVKFIQSK